MTSCPSAKLKGLNQLYKVSFLSGYHPPVLDLNILLDNLSLNNSTAQSNIEYTIQLELQ